ncbi:hypothetical protein Bca101_040629 [Brassica carinata]
MNIGSNSGQGRGPGQAESGGSSNESSSFSGGLMFGQKIYFEDGGGGSSSSAGSNRRVGGGGVIQVRHQGAKWKCSRFFISFVLLPILPVVSSVYLHVLSLPGRFHQLPEFDLEKRSCRRRLAGHNERRRKPQPASLSVLSSRYGRIAPSLYEISSSAGPDMANTTSNFSKAWPIMAATDLIRPLAEEDPSSRVGELRRCAELGELAEEGNVGSG